MARNVEQVIITMVKKGRMIYVPPKAVNELENIEKTYNITRARAFDKMAEFVPVGMEIEKAIHGTGLIGFLRKKKK